MSDSFRESIIKDLINNKVPVVDGQKDLLEFLEHKVDNLYHNFYYGNDPKQLAIQHLNTFKKLVNENKMLKQKLNDVEYIENLSNVNDILKDDLL